jgi:hypothetical protein
MGAPYFHIKHVQHGIVAVSTNYAHGVVVELPYPTDDARLMTKAAVDAVNQVFRPGFQYSKAEVLLVNLCQKGEYTDDLFFHLPACGYGEGDGGAG